MRKILQTIITILIISWVYLTTQAFNSNLSTPGYTNDIPYDENIDGTVTFDAFTTFSIAWNNPSWCNANSWSCGPWRTATRPRACEGNDGIGYDYAACGWEPATIYNTCDAGTCYPGRWVANSAPNCRTSCGYGWGTVYWTVTCQWGACDPSATKPNAKQRTCSRTDDCVTRVNGTCGSADGSSYKVLSSIPSAHLCSRGTYWNNTTATAARFWDCAWSGWGSTDSCEAQKSSTNTNVCSWVPEIKRWDITSSGQYCCEAVCTQARWWKCNLTKWSMQECP